MCEDLNKWLHENVMKECWHKKGDLFSRGPSPVDDMFHCKKCQKPFLRRDDEEFPDYLHDPAAYWRLLQKVKEHKKWPNFISAKYMHWNGTWGLIETLLDLPRGCQAIREFKWEGV